MGNVTHYAKAWLNISPEIRAYLEEGRLQRRIRWLQQVGQGFYCPGSGEGVIFPPRYPGVLHVVLLGIHVALVETSLDPCTVCTLSPIPRRSFGS